MSATATNVGLLRFSTAGSVDDGKSTLIGRLLHDTKQIFEDQLQHVEEASKRRGFDRTELALLTDGLRAEREQGITIDVAYRYFATPKRKFIIADTPGHVQYTRNMVTGASTADLAIVLVDARNGMTEQSRRHAFIATLLRTKHLAVAVNKMDLVGFDRARFEAIKEEFAAFAKDIGAVEVTYLPISALHGDNVADRSDKTPWYEGPTLLEHLESVELEPKGAGVKGRFPVQWVIRPQNDAHHDYRGYGGSIAGGTFKPGDAVVVLPAGIETRVKAVDTYDGALAEASAPKAVTLLLEDNVDVSRGDMIAHREGQPTVGNELRAEVCWMHPRACTVRGTYLLKHTTRTVKAMVTGIEHRTDVNTREKQPAAKLELNDLGRITLKTVSPIAYDPYETNRETGAFILVDEATNATVAGGMLLGS